MSTEATEAAIAAVSEIDSIEGLTDVQQAIEDARKRLARQTLQPGDPVMYRKRGGSRVVGTLVRFRQKNAEIFGCRNLSTGNVYKRGRVVSIADLEPAPEGVETEPVPDYIMNR